jgi:hypothetical protein
MSRNIAVSILASLMIIGMAVSMAGASGWVGLGGDIEPGISAVYDSSGLHAFVMGNDSQLWEYSEAGWVCLGGVIASAPCAVIDSAGKIHVLVMGADNALWRYDL